jgi:F5/8 type C domain/Core-2/I-Branching enzyme
MTRLAFLVLGALAPDVLGQHIQTLKAHPVRFFVHVDQRIDMIDYQARVGPSDAVTYLTERIPIFWGGFSMIRATMALAEHALAIGDFASYSLISDDTFPLQPMETLIDSCLADVAQLEIWDASTSADRVERYSHFHYRDSNLTNFRNPVANADRCVKETDLIAMQEIADLMKRGKKNVRLYGGSQWWTLTPRHLSGIVDLFHSDQHMTKSFTYALIPDESYIQTAFKICFPKEPHKGSPVLVDWHRPPPKPHIFETCADLVNARLADNGKHLFVRKVRPKTSNELADFTALLHQATPFRRSRNAILTEFSDRYRTENFALSKACTQSSVSEWSRGSTPELDAKTANDGNIRSYSCFHTLLEPNPWWQVDLGVTRNVRTVALFNREDMASRLNQFDLQVSSNGKEWKIAYSRTEDTVWGHDGAPHVMSFEKPIVTRFIRVALNGTNFLHFRELQVFGEQNEIALP